VLPYRDGGSEARAATRDAVTRVPGGWYPVLTVRPDPPIRPLRKAVFALGDLSTNTALAAFSLIFASYFLVQVAGLRPLLAGLVPLVGRVIDAFTDPLMGRISDRTRSPWGRRRPWMLLGAAPYGVAFAMVWADPGIASEWGRFAYWAIGYCLVTVCMTVLSVPYLALIPEMALQYDARTSLNTYRAVGANLGIFAALGIRPVAEALGGGKAGFAAAGVAYGIALALPWLAVHRVTFERPEFGARPTAGGVLEGFLVAFRQKTFMRLTAIYIMGRIAMDLASALLILYVSYWLGRSEEFEPLMAVFLVSVIAALPLWLRAARGRDKADVFIMASLCWIVFGFGLAFVSPSWPSWTVFAYVPLVGLGFAAVDLMPWAMLGEVIDEDELESGERREGLYNGMFTFLRKLGGATAVFLVLGILDLLGYRKGAEQTETARQAIRWMTGVGPAVFLAVGATLARGFPLTRARHREIVQRLGRRGADEAS
jgi:sugar (glycoside-pentoside-hexuronide) transporter